MNTQSAIVGGMLLVAFVATMGIVASQTSGREQAAAFVNPSVVNQSINPPELSAIAVLSILVGNDGSERVLFEKNSEGAHPPASIIKILAAIVAVEQIPHDTIITISERAADMPGSPGELRAGERFRMEDLLRALLIESNNDAAEALAETVGRARFLERMRETARAIGMRDTRIANPTGLDTNPGSPEENITTAEDLVKLARYFLEKQPDLAFITRTPAADLLTADGAIHHRIESTNLLLSATSTSEYLGARILGGKTGETPLSKQNLLLITEAPGQGYVIHVLLGSTEDRFAEMLELIRWSDAILEKEA